MSWNLDFTGETPDQVDLAAGVLPQGYYRAVLDAQEDDSESGAKRLTFRVCQGLHKGKKLTERVSNPTFLDGSAAEVATKRARIFAVRMGAVPRDARGVVQPNWGQAIGREFVIKVKHREYTNAKTGAKGEAIELDFAGIFDVGHKDIPADVRKHLELPPIEGSAPAADAKTPAAGGGNGGGTPAAPAADPKATAAALWG